MNTKARHEHRRLQTPAHPCWCAIHRGSNSPKGYGHAIGDGRIALWRAVAPGDVIETGPWFDETGVVDPTITRSPGADGGHAGPIRVTKRIRGLRAETRRWEKLARQASKNPKYPAREFLVASAGWIAAGAEVTPEGPVFKARIERA